MACRERRRMANHEWARGVLCPCARSGSAGLLRGARNDDELSPRHCEEGGDRRGNPESAAGVCYAPVPLAPLDCFAMLAMTLIFFPSLRGGRRPTRQSRTGHQGLIRCHAPSGLPGLLRFTRNDEFFPPSLRGGRRPTWQSRIGRWGLLCPCARSGPAGLLRVARNDVDFFLRHCEEALADVAIHGWARGLFRCRARSGLPGLLPATGAPSRPKVITLAMTGFLLCHSGERSGYSFHSLGGL